jgi:catechol 2,3-dioxygenase-like lactoylglutathione lyase family enzyme
MPLHVRLLVENYERCFGFYRDVLGLEVTFGDATSGYADLRTSDGAGLALFARAEQGEVVELRPPGDGAVLVFGVDDVDAFVARHGEVVVGPTQSRSEWGIRFAHLRDPDGHLIEVNQQIPMEE